MNNTILYALLMLVAGLGIPLMAALNGGLGVRLQNPALAAAILFLIGLGIALIYLALFAGFAFQIPSSGISWYYFSGGVFVMFYILSITWVAPKFGVANAVAFVLLGQLIAMSVIDHFGLFGAVQHVLTLKRLMGLVLMAAGVFLVLARTDIA